MTHPWPLFDLRLRSPRLELRLPTDADALALLDVARQGIHDPDAMPFAVAWTDLRGEAFEQGFLRFLWSARASWSTGSWRLPLAVVVDERPVGIQEVQATDFPVLRTVETGSWLGSAWQGQGFGTEMRAAALGFAFRGLGAVAAMSAALEGNVASRRVSEKLGYRDNGIGSVAPRGVPVRQERFLLLREDYRADRWPVEIIGLDGCLGMFGRSDPDVSLR